MFCGGCANGAMPMFQSDTLPAGALGSPVTDLMISVAMARLAVTCIGTVTDKTTDCQVPRTIDGVLLCCTIKVVALPCGDEKR